MKTEEHLLMLSLYFTQRRAIRFLLDALKSRGILTDDDEQAFLAVLNMDSELNAALYEEARQAYVAMAEPLGIQTGLDRLPEPPLEWFRPPQS
jgi:hypothetical protein